MRRSENGHHLVDGYILVQASSGHQASELADVIAGIPGVVNAQRVHGPYDVIAEVLESDDGAGATPAARAIGALDGVLRAIPLSKAIPAASYEGSDGAAA